MAGGASSRPGMSGGGGGIPRPGGMGGAPGAGLGARRDTTEKKEKIIYFSQLNFDETSNDRMLAKVTFGTLAALVLLTVAAVFLNWGINAFIGLGIAYAFWLFYFISSLVKYPRMAFLPYKDKKNYWTYELTEEYTQRNVALNDFKRYIGTQLIRPQDKVLIDDVSVELMSYDPLIFDFAIRAGIKKDQIMRSVPDWGGQFGCESGTITSTGINTWRVVYPRKSKWETLAGKKISPADVVGEHKDASIGYNPIGIRTDTFEEMHISNVDQHTVITGESGYGKSNTFNLILSNQFESNALILFFDAKQLEAPALNDRCFSVITYEQAEAWDASVREELTRRSQVLAKHGKAKLLPPEEAEMDPDAMPFTDDMPPIILAVDECGMWLSKSGGLPAQNFRKFIEDVSRVGRATGVTLICGSQSPRDTDIPDMVKRNASQFIAYRQSKETEAAAVGNKTSLSPSEANPSDIPLKDAKNSGIGQFSLATSSTDNLGVPVKAYFVTKDSIIAKAKQNKSNKKLNLRIVERASLRYEKIKEKSKNVDDLPVSLIDPTIPGSISRNL